MTEERQTGERST